MESNHIIKSRDDVNTFLSRLKYALKNEHTFFEVMFNRKSEELKDIRYTNLYTINDLAPPDVTPSEFVKREIAKLKITEYVYCVPDDKFPDKDIFYVFVRKYPNGKQVYIKVRATLLTSRGDLVLVISFHYSEWLVLDNAFLYIE